MELSGILIKVAYGMVSHLINKFGYIQSGLLELPWVLIKWPTG